MKNQRKLKSLLIDTDYQGKFLIIFGSFGLLQIFLFFFAITTVFREVKNLMALNLTKEEILSQVLGVESSIFLLFGGVYLILTIVFLVFAFRFTHKTAGALYRFKMTFVEMKTSGKLKEIHLRDGDFFKDVAKEFNSFVIDFKSKSSNQD